MNFEETRFQDAEKHHCTSQQKGDWIIFTCNQCSYMRMKNWKTGEMRVKNNSSVPHTGRHVPAGMQHLMYVPN